MRKITLLCLAFILALSSCLEKDYPMVSFTEQFGNTFLSWSPSDTSYSNYFDFFYACSPLRSNTRGPGDIDIDKFDIYLQGDLLISQGNGEGFALYDPDGSFSFKEIENLHELIFEPLISPIRYATYIYMSRENNTTYYTKILIEEFEYTNDYSWIKFVWARSDSEGIFRF